MQELAAERHCCADSAASSDKVQAYRPTYTAPLPLDEVSCNCLHTSPDMLLSSCWPPGMHTVVLQPDSAVWQAALSVGRTDDAELRVHQSAIWPRVSWHHEHGLAS